MVPGNTALRSQRSELMVCNDTLQDPEGPPGAADGETLWKLSHKSRCTYYCVARLLARVDPDRCARTFVAISAGVF